MLYLSTTHRPGLSLIEIIVALFIMSIMAVGAFQAFKFVNQSRVTKTETVLSSIRIDLERFKNDVGSYPTSLRDLVQKPSDASLSRGWRGPYADEVPTDAWRQEFEYALNQKGATHPYELHSWGKNGTGSPEDEWISVWNQQ